MVICTVIVSTRAARDAQIDEVDFIFAGGRCSPFFVGYGWLTILGSAYH
jgi:hypothetical protein